MSKFFGALTEILINLCYPISLMSYIKFHIYYVSVFDAIKLLKIRDGNIRAPINACIETYVGVAEIALKATVIIWNSLL
jgi:hypothetical protein